MGLTDAIQSVETKASALSGADAGVQTALDAEAAAQRKLAAAVETRTVAAVADQSAIDEYNAALDGLIDAATSAKRGPVVAAV